MDAVYIKNVREEHQQLTHAWEFTDDETVDRDNFCCPHSVCNIDQRLVSHLLKKKIERKQKEGDSTGNKAGHFRCPSRNIKHHDDCPEHPDNKKKRKKVNGIDPSSPYEHISKIIFREETGQHTGRTTSGNIISNKENHHHQAYHISNAVMWYLQNPDQGGNHLHLSGCSFHKYRDIFQRIIQNPDRRYIGKHLYFGSLEVKNSENFNIVDGQAIFNIYQYSEKGKAEPVKVFLSVENFSKYKLDFVKKVYRYAERKRLELKSKNKTRPKTWIFFYGQPTEPGARDFIVDRHDCIFFFTEYAIELPVVGHYHVEKAPKSIPPKVIEKPLEPSYSSLLIPSNESNSNNNALNYINASHDTPNIRQTKPTLSEEKRTNRDLSNIEKKPLSFFQRITRLFSSK